MRFARAGSSAHGYAHGYAEFHSVAELPAIPVALVVIEKLVGLAPAELVGMQIPSVGRGLVALFHPRIQLEGAMRMVAAGCTITRDALRQAKGA